MKLSIFSIFDSKAGAYLQPYFSLNTAVGVRAFKGACLDPDTEFNHNPGDYTLFELGEFDQESGKLEPHHVQINLGMPTQFSTEMKTEERQLKLYPVTETGS